MRCSLVNYEESFPNILFAKNGTIYDFEGKKVIVIEDSYSINKHYRLTRGLAWFETEQPSDEIKEYVETEIELLKN